ncbi:hypothetical protein BDV19DRAFT_384236 [Aspergillus venezuelensis]
MEQEPYEIARKTVYVFDKVFQIKLSNESFENAPPSLKKFHLLLAHLEGILEPTEDKEDPYEELRDWILEPLQSIFNSYLEHKSYRQYTFDDWLYSETISYSIKAAEPGILYPIFLSKQSRVRYYHVGADLDIDLFQYTAFPIYSTKDITIDASGDETSLLASPQKDFIKNQVQGQTIFLKLVLTGDGPITTREISKYAAIQSSRFGATASTSNLNGLLRDDEMGFIVALLLSYIDCGDGNCDRAKAH